MKMFIFGLILMSMQNCCKDEITGYHKTIIFKNNSLKELYIMDSNKYPDTMSFQYGGNLLSQPKIYKVSPNDSNYAALFSKTFYETLFYNKVIIPSDTLMIFVFDGKVLEQIPWNEVYTNYFVAQRYDLSLNDLKKLNWTITYPPVESMKDMHMYPPYKK